MHTFIQTLWLYSNFKILKLESHPDFIYFKHIIQSRNHYKFSTTHAQVLRIY